MTDVIDLDKHRRAKEPVNPDEGPTLCVVITTGESVRVLIPNAERLSGWLLHPDVCDDIAIELVRFAEHARAEMQKLGIDPDDEGA